MEDAPGLLSAELGTEEFEWLSQSCEPVDLRAGEALVTAGLGLDIVYSIVVRRHSGSIQVSSKPGDTRFRVLLPLTPAPARELDEMRPVSIVKESV